MKKTFAFDLRPMSILVPFLLYWISYLIFQAYSNRFSAVSETGAQDVVLQMLPVFFLLLLSFVIVTSIITPMIVEKMINACSMDSTPFVFKGKIGSYVGLILGGMALTIITLGIYFGWYYKNIVNYFCKNTEYKGSPFAFHGKPWQLLLMFFGIIALSGLTSFVLVTVLSSSQKTMMEIASSLLIFVMIIPFIYLIYKWIFNITYTDHLVFWKTDFFPSCGVIFREFFLTIITIGIYFPVASLKLISYFASRTIISKNNEEIASFKTEYPLKEGFLLIWGQTLLCIITIGIYLPWAWAKIGKWMAERTTLIGKN